MYWLSIKERMSSFAGSHPLYLSFYGPNHEGVMDKNQALSHSIQIWVANTR